MSTYTESQVNPVRIPDLIAARRDGRPIVMVTAYDYPSGRVAEAAGVDVVLVGDSGAQVVLGHPDTTAVTLEEMLLLARATRRAVRRPLLVVDLPFGSFEQSDAQAVASAVRLVKEGGADAVKIEGGGRMTTSRIRAIVEAGVPVVGHVGLTPQTAVALGGLRAQGRTVESALEIARGARAVQQAGAFLIVFEAVPSAVTAAVLPLLQVPVIGIGAGPANGQVLVFHDLLGIRDGHGAKFVRRYADIQDAMVDGVGRYANDVRSGEFPAPEHEYRIADDELAMFRTALAEEFPA